MRYILAVTTAQLLSQCLALPEDERLDIAAELLTSVDGPPDADWEEAWDAEIARRVESAAARGEPASEWTEVRRRVLAKLAAK
jgi:putative addiction module component (TIGR02574 family)